MKLVINSCSLQHPLNFEMCSLTMNFVHKILQLGFNPYDFLLELIFPYIYHHNDPVTDATLQYIAHLPCTNTIIFMDEISSLALQIDHNWLSRCFACLGSLVVSTSLDLDKYLLYMWTFINALVGFCQTQILTLIDHLEKQKD